MMEMPDEIRPLVARYPEIGGILSDPLLNNIQRKEKLAPILNTLRAESSDLRNKLKERESELVSQVDELTYLNELAAWLGEIDKNFSLERNEHSRLHDLLSAMKNGHVRYESEEDGEFYRTHKTNDNFFVGCQSFVVEHDWAQAFKGASDYDGEVQIPYPVSAFEFRVSGKTVINIAVQDEEREITDSKFAMLPFIKLSAGGWACLGDKVVKNNGFIAIYEEIKAVCVALEAEIAISEVVRAPTKLNKKRVEQKKLPLFDYHIVRLNRKGRSDFNGGGTHRSPRFHFRRGHWRHYETHKTYIKWMLVGSPELGFIDKHYRI